MKKYVFYILCMYAVYMVNVRGVPRFHPPAVLFPLERNSHFGWSALTAAINTHLPPQTQKYDVTVITAYFQLDKSKFSHSQYQTWMKNFWSSVSAPIVAFTTDIDKPHLSKLRGVLPAMFITFESLWHVPPAAHYQDLFVRQHANLDPEGFRHSPELYAIWDFKAWFTATTAIHNPFNSKYFMWVDAGSFRQRSFIGWPAILKVAHAFQLCKHDSCVIVAKISAATVNLVNATDKRGSLGDVFQGGFFAGTRSGMLWWCIELFDLLNEHIRHGVFVGKDQTLYNQMTVQNYWRTAWIASYALKHCGPDTWFAFEYVFADGDADGCQNAMERYDGREIVALE